MGRMVVLAMLGLAWTAAAVEPDRLAAHPPAKPMSSDFGQGSVAGILAKPAQGGEDTNNTVITSTQLLFDQQKRTAEFEGHVVVTDHDVKIMSDRLEVFFTEDNKVSPFKHFFFQC